MFKIVYIYFLFLCGFNVCLCFDDAWQLYQTDIRNANREELVITNVVSDENFKLDYKVRKWKSLSVGPVCYSVGLMDNGLTILFSTLNDDNTKFIINSTVVDLKKKPLEVLLTEHINNIGNKEIILIISFYDKRELNWFKIVGSNLIPFWTWHLQKSVRHINIFQMNRKNMLLIGNNYHENFATADIHEFDLSRNYSKLRHSIDLSVPAESSAFNNFQTDYYLSFPQNSSISIYKYKDCDFIEYKTIPSQNVSSIISFEIGFKSFIAFNGLDAGIYQFKRNEVVKEKIENSHLDAICYWSSIPVNTFRDEVILLAQRTVDHATHKSNIVDILTYNGRTFEEHEDIPCSHFGEQVKWLTCLTSGNGIIGSGSINIENTLGLIVPRIANSSFLFMVQYSLKTMPNPKENEIKMLKKDQKKLQLMIDEQKKEYEQLKNEYQAVKKNEQNLKASRIKSDNILLKSNKREEQIRLREKVEDVGLEIKKVKAEVDKIIERESKKEYNTITINGPVKIEGYSQFKDVEVDTIEGIPAKEFLENIVRKDSSKKIIGNKTFTDLEVENISFQVVNGIKADEIVVKNDSKTFINGDITFTQPINVSNIQIKSGRINGIDLDNDIINNQKKYNGSLQFDTVKVINNFGANQINNWSLPFSEFNPSHFKTNKDLDAELDSISIPQNVTVVNINRENLDKFIHQLCLVNIKCYIPGQIKINGNIIVENETSTDYLNGLKFPEEYVLKQPMAHLNITGKKVFRNSLVAEEIQIKGKIDDLDTKELITLSTRQKIPGKITFNDTEVTNALNVCTGCPRIYWPTDISVVRKDRNFELKQKLHNIQVTGKIIGKDIEKFLQNPTLKDTDIIKAKVNFEHLEVEGDIIIEHTLNKNNFSALLNDLVYKDDENVTILSHKVFPLGFSVKENLEVESESINDKKLNAFVANDTNQVLDISLLQGNVTFENLQVQGLYGGINITQWEQSLVKLTGDQIINSSLIFEDDLKVENLEITEKLNDLKAEEYFFTDEDRNIPQELRFERIEADSIFVEGNIVGNLTDIDLNDFNERYLSYTKDQVIEQSFHIEHLKVDNLKTDLINNVSYYDFFDQDLFLDKMRDLLEQGQFRIENLIVNGSILIERINNKLMDDLLPVESFLTENNKRKELNVEGNVYFDKLEINKLGSFSWDELISRIIFKDEVKPGMKLYSKTFTNGIKVNKLIETKKLNNVTLENIFTKEGNQNIKGPVVINGDVYFENVNISEDINGLIVKDILEKVTIENETYTVEGDIFFPRLSHIYDLTVNGYMNDKNVTHHLSHIIFLDKDYNLTDEVIFEKPVNISGNFAITQNFNNIKLSDILSRIVLTTKDEEIEGVVHFTKPVFIQTDLTIDQNVLTNRLFGIDLEDWKNKAVFVDQGFLNGSFTFEEAEIHDNLIAKFVNDVDMSSVIPLRTNQSIKYLEFDNIRVVNNIHVGNLVNGYNLPKEYNKTVLADEEQGIFSNIIFKNNVMVRDTLTTPFINSLDVSKIVTTDTDQNLTSVFDFNSKCTIESDLNVHGFINGINISVWKNNPKLLSKNIQNIHNNWNISHELIFSENVDGDGLINEMNLTSLVEKINKKEKSMYEVERAVINDYQNMCKDVEYIYQATKKQIYKFKYFEQLQVIKFDNKIHFADHFEYENNHYLLINENKCLSHLMIFNKTAFVVLDQLETGHISQVITVYDKDLMYLVTRGVDNNEECEAKGTNVWEFTEKNLTHLQNIEDQILLQESQVSGTFYGLSKKEVIEFKIVKHTGVRKYRKWKISEDNGVFVPRGLETGLSLSTGRKVLFLDRTDPMVENDSELEGTIIGNVVEDYNNFIPGRKGSDLVVTRVGIESARRNLLAVATHEETSVKGRLDFIKIYSNPLKGELFHKVPTYKPSSLVSIEFGQGETLLVFMENEKTLQVYEYKGIEGFKHRTSAKIRGSRLFSMTLPIHLNLNPRKAIGIVDGNKITIIQAVMLGNKIRNDLKCGL